MSEINTIYLVLPLMVFSFVMGYVAHIEATTHSAYAIESENPQYAQHINDTYNLKNSAALVVTPEFKTIMSSTWNDYALLGVEYAACIEGNIDTTGNTVVITLTNLTHITNGTAAKAPVIDCNNYMGRVHSHPHTGCLDHIWSGDVHAAKNIFRHGAVAWLVQCEENAFELYTRDNLYEGQIIEFQQ